MHLEPSTDGQARFIMILSYPSVLFNMEGSAKYINKQSKQFVAQLSGQNHEALCAAANYEEQSRRFVRRCLFKPTAEDT